MGLLFRILKKFYLLSSMIIQSSMIDDSYHEYHVLLVWLANVLTIVALFGGFGLALYALVWAFSLEIFVKALLIAYLLAWLWSKFCNYFTSFEQEMYLIGSTVGYTGLIGVTIQLHRMQWADGKTLFIYWTFLLIIGFILWQVTLFNVRKASEFKSVLFSQKFAYKYKFLSTKLPKKIPPNNQAQAYLKKMK